MATLSPSKLELGHLLFATMQTLARSPAAVILFVGSGAGLDIWLSFGALDAGYQVAASIAASFILGFVLLRSTLRASGMKTGPIIDDFAGYFTLYVVTTLAIAFGFVMLIIPGAILAVRWTPALAIGLADSTTMRETLRRSWAMTSGSEWPILAAVLIAFAPPAVLAIGLIAAGVNTDPSPGLGYSIWSLVIEVAAFWCASAFIWALGVSTYLLLRNDTGELVETFA